MKKFLLVLGKSISNAVTMTGKCINSALNGVRGFFWRYKTVSILVGLGAAVAIFAFLSIGSIGDNFFPKTQEGVPNKAGVEGGSGNDKVNKNGNKSSNGEGNTSNNKDNTGGTSDVTPSQAPDVNINNQEPKNNEFMKNVKVKGIYISGWVAGVEQRFDKIIKMVNETELNSIVLDVKEDKGKVTYKSEVPWVNEVGAAVNMVGDINKIMQKFKDNKIYPIGRIVSFKDPILGEKRPELAIKSKNGGLWRDNKGNTWLNPYNEESWKYLVELAKEAAKLGFQDIQFDYVRFPTDGKVSMINYGEAALTKTKADAISGFLSYAKKELEPFGVHVSADIFGIVSVVEGDYEQIGQHLEMVSKEIDYICPMVYPSHYANVAQNGVGQKINGVLFKYPDLEPYQVVYNTMFLTKQRLEKAQSKAKGRPYLQDFTAPYLGKGNYQVYGAEQVRAQIKATYDAGFEEWILWDADNTYTEAALLRE